MNWVDLAIPAVLALTAVWGLFVGFVEMLVLLVVMGGGLALASRFAGTLGGIILSPLTDNAAAQTIILLLVMLAVLLIIFFLVSLGLRAIMQRAPSLGRFDRVAGAVVGFLVGFVVLSVVLTNTWRFPIGDVKREIENSPVASFLADNSGPVIRAIKLVPGDWGF